MSGGSGRSSDAFKARRLTVTDEDTGKTQYFTMTDGQLVDEDGNALSPAAQAALDADLTEMEGNGKAAEPQPAPATKAPYKSSMADKTYEELVETARDLSNGLDSWVAKEELFSRHLSADLSNLTDEETDWMKAVSENRFQDVTDAGVKALAEDETATPQDRAAAKYELDRRTGNLPKATATAKAYLRAYETMDDAAYANETLEADVSKTPALEAPITDENKARIIATTLAHRTIAQRLGHEDSRLPQGWNVVSEGKYDPETKTYADEHATVFDHRWNRVATFNLTATINDDHTPKTATMTNFQTPATRPLDQTAFTQKFGNRSCGGGKASQAIMETHVESSLRQPKTDKGLFDGIAVPLPQGQAIPAETAYDNLQKHFGLTGNEMPSRRTPGPFERVNEFTVGEGTDKRTVEIQARNTPLPGGGRDTIAVTAKVFNGHGGHHTVTFNEFGENNAGFYASRQLTVNGHMDHADRIALANATDSLYDLARTGDHKAFQKTWGKGRITGRVRPRKGE